jgi:hypothetical protein
VTIGSMVALKLINQGVNMSNTYGFFIKFSNNISHLEAIEEGNIYMNNGKYFIDLEKSTGIKGIGDKNEYNNIVHDVNVTLFDRKTNKELAKIESIQLTTRLYMYLYSPIFCMCLVEGDYIEECISDDGIEFLRINPKNLDIEKIEKEFGKYAILISFDKFVERFKRVCENHDYKLARAPIKYSDFSINDFSRSKTYYKASNYGYFYKDSSYSHQLEYRFVITNKEIRRPYVFNIGSIADYSMIVKTSDLLKLAIKK